MKVKDVVVKQWDYEVYFKNDFGEWRLIFVFDCKEEAEKLTFMIHEEYETQIRERCYITKQGG